MSIEEQNVSGNGAAPSLTVEVDSGTVNVDALQIDVVGDGLVEASKLTPTVDSTDPDPVATVNATIDAFRSVNSGEVVESGSEHIDPVDDTFIAQVEQQRKRGEIPGFQIIDESPYTADAEESVVDDSDAGFTPVEDELTDEDKEMVSLELTPQDFMIRMLGIDLAMAQIYPEPIYLVTDADAADLLAREGLQYSFDSEHSVYLCGMADPSIRVTLIDPDLRILALRAVKFKHRRFDQPVEEAIKAVTAALRKQQHDIAAAQAAEAAAHMATDGAEQPQQ